MFQDPLTHMCQSDTATQSGTHRATQRGTAAQGATGVSSTTCFQAGCLGVQGVKKNRVVQNIIFNPSVWSLENIISSPNILASVDVLFHESYELASVFL